MPKAKGTYWTETKVAHFCPGGCGTRLYSTQGHRCRKCWLLIAQADTLAARFWAKVAKGDGCWVWTGFRVRKGYGRLRRLDGGTQLAHRIALELATGSPPPADRLVCHRCNNPPCVRPDHLYVGTYLDNAEDRRAAGNY